MKRIISARRARATAAATPQTAAAYGEAARRLASTIEGERCKIQHLTFTDLHCPDVIRQMGELERMINEFILLVYVRNDGSMRRKPQ